MTAREAPPSLRGTSRRTRRRKAVNRLLETLATLAALVAVALLALVVVSVARRGAGALSLDFFTSSPVPFGQTGGGLEDAFVGTAILVGLATAMALPVGVLTGVYLAELAPRRAAVALRVALDVLNGIPSIVIGIFVFGLLVAGHSQSGWAAGFALAVIMLPLVARATQETLELVPRTLREGALALGAPRWRVLLTVVLPTAVGGILTGTTLAVARVAGETAPLLFTSSIFANAVTTDPGQALPNVPVSIFVLSESPDPADHQRAWAAALVLIGLVLVASLAARALSARSRRRVEQLG